MLANAVPLVGVVAFGWDLHSLLVVYWLEGGVVGASFWAKIRRAEGEDDPDELAELFLDREYLESFVGESRDDVARYFAGHYGWFWVGHGVFVLAFFPLLFPMDLADPATVATATLALGGYHALSYRIDFVGRREYERKGPVRLMAEPYGRVTVLHVTVVFGALGVAAVGSPVGLLVVLVLAKTAMDLRGHRSEPGEAEPRGQPSRTH